LRGAYRVVRAAVHNSHLQNWFGKRGDRLPRADPLEHMARTGGYGARATATFSLAHARIDDQNAGAAPQRLFQ
jgi:hypothetical protein